MRSTGWSTGPMPWPPASYGTLITNVRITLSARSMQSDLAGERGDAQGRRFIRQSLTTTTAIRSALFIVSEGTASGVPPNVTPAQWH